MLKRELGFRQKPRCVYRPPRPSFFSLFLTCSTVTAQQLPQGAVRGAVTDSSGGVLPGVTVLAASKNGQLLATAVTDGSGRYLFRGLPAEIVMLTFQLEGFADVTVTLAVEPGAETRTVQRLELASLSETVVVRAAATVDLLRVPVLDSIRRPRLRRSSRDLCPPTIAAPCAAPRNLRRFMRRSGRLRRAVMKPRESST